MGKRRGGEKETGKEETLWVLGGSNGAGGGGIVGCWWGQSLMLKEKGRERETLIAFGVDGSVGLRYSGSTFSTSISVYLQARSQQSTNVGSRQKSTRLTCLID